jgi:hypothetical protein
MLFPADDQTVEIVKKMLEEQTALAAHDSGGPSSSMP